MQLCQGLSDIWNTCVNPILWFGKLFSISNRHQKLRLPVQPVLRTRSNTASHTQSLLTHYQRAKHLEGLFQYNYRAPQGSLCQKSDSHVVCRLQNIPKYTPFQKPTQSTATVPHTYLLSQLFLLNTCLRKTERTQACSEEAEECLFIQEGEETAQVHKCGKQQSPEKRGSYCNCETAQTPLSPQLEFSQPLYWWVHRKKPLAIHLDRK